MTCFWSERLIHSYLNKHTIGKFYHGEKCKEHACLVIKITAELAALRATFLAQNNLLTILSDLAVHSCVGLPAIPLERNQILVFIGKDHFLAKQFKLDLNFGLFAQENVAQMPKLLFVGCATFFKTFTSDVPNEEWWIIQEPLHDQIVHSLGLPDDQWCPYQCAMDQIYYYNKQSYIDFDMKSSNLLKVGFQEFRHVDAELCVSVQNDSVPCFLQTLCPDAWIESPTMINWQLFPLQIMLNIETFSMGGFINKHGTTILKMLTTTQLLPNDDCYYLPKPNLPGAIERAHEALAPLLEESFGCQIPFLFFEAFCTASNGMRTFSDLLTLRPLIWFPRLAHEDKQKLLPSTKLTILYHLLYEMCIEFFVESDLEKMSWWGRFINQDRKTWEDFYALDLENLTPTSMKKTFCLDSLYLFLVDKTTIIRTWTARGWELPKTSALCYNAEVDGIEINNVLLTNKYIHLFMNEDLIEQQYVSVYDAMLSINDLQCDPPLESAEFQSKQAPTHVALAVAIDMLSGPNRDISMANNWLRGPIVPVDASQEDVLAGELVLEAIARGQDVGVVPAFLEKSKEAIERNLDGWQLTKLSKKKNKHQ